MIEFSVFLGLRIRLAQDTTQDLFNRRGADLLGNGAQDVGKGTIPTFTQGLHGNDITDGALRREQINVCDLIIIACGSGDLVFGDVVVFQQALFDRFHIDGSLIFVGGLCLQKTIGRRYSPVSAGSRGQPLRVRCVWLWLVRWQRANPVAFPDRWEV